MRVIGNIDVQGFDPGNPDRYTVAMNCRAADGTQLSASAGIDWGSSIQTELNAMKDAIIAQYAPLGITTTRQEIQLFAGPTG